MDYFFLMRLIIRDSSPIHKTREVPRVIHIHCVKLNGIVLKTLPPKLTTRICPTTMAEATMRKPLLWDNPLKAELFVPKVLALNMFQNCSMTNVVKNMVRFLSPSGVLVSIPPA